MIKSLDRFLKQRKERYRIPRRVQDLIPIQCIWTDGIFRSGAFMRGWREDAGVYRCRATVDEAPVYKEYLTKINRLRDEFRDETLNSILRDTELATSSNPDLEYQTFETDDKIAVVATQSFKAKMVSTFTVDGASKLLKTGGLGDYKVKGDGNKIDVEVGKDGLVVLVFKKK